MKHILTTTTTTTQQSWIVCEKIKINREMKRIITLQFAFMYRAAFERERIFSSESNTKHIARSRIITNLHFFSKEKRFSYPFDFLFLLLLHSTFTYVFIYPLEKLKSWKLNVKTHQTNICFPSLSYSVFRFAKNNNESSAVFMLELNDESSLTCYL